jgi:LPS-assembly protein
MGGRRLILTFSFFFSFLLILSASTFAQTFSPLQVKTPGEPIRIQADHISYDKIENTYVAEGKVEVWQGDRKLTADRVSFNAGTSEAEATGNVVLVQAGDILQSEQVKIDLDTSRGIILKGTLFLKQQNFYLRGEEIERVGENTYRVKEGKFTTCDGDSPAWRFTGREALVTVGEYASVHGATFEVKKIPVLYSPYLFFPVKTERQSGFLTPAMNFSNVAGPELKVAYFWAISKNTDATFYLDLAPQKGYGEGAEYLYIREKGSAGSFYGYHIREEDQYRQKYTDQQGRPPDRWTLDLQHEEYFSQAFFAKARLRDFSDRLYLKDYGLTYQDRALEQAYSIVSLTKNWERTSLYGEARNTLDLTQDTQSTLQYYPIINFTGLKQQISNSPFYFSYTSAFGNFYRQQGVTGQQLDIFPQLTLPLKWGNYLEFTPAAGVRETVYHSRNGSEETHGRELWNFTATLASNFYGVFDSGMAGVPKFKHLIRPEITYTYIPDVDQQFVPNFGTRVAKSNAFTYAITQRLIGKVLDGPQKIRYHEYAYLKLSQTYDLNEANRQISNSGDARRPFGPITGELRVRSLKYVSADNITTFDTNQGQFLSSYSSVTATDPRGDRLQFEHLWQQGVQNQMNGIVRIRVLSFLDAIYGKRFSFTDNQSLETTYGLGYRHQCWAIDLFYTEKPAVAGAPAENKLWFTFTLKGVASAGQR